MTRPARGRSSSAVVLLTTALLAGLLSGCAPEPDLTDATATRLQGDVLEVTRAAAAGDLPTARTALDALTAQLATERESGALTPERKVLIDAAIVLVSADLTTLEADAARVQAEAEAAAAEAAATAAATKAAADAQRSKDNKKNHDDD